MCRNESRGVDHPLARGSLDGDGEIAAMGDSHDPVVIGHLPTSGEANLARNRLRDAGIPAEIADDITVDMDWGLNLAIGMVKVLVPGDCADEARAVIADKVSDVELEYSADKTCDQPEPDEPLDQPPNEREANAERAYRGAFLGVLFWPFQFYILWVLIKIFVADACMRPRYRRQALVAFAFSLPFIVIQLLIAHLFFGAFMEWLST
jgi:hypothetical protein